MIPVPSDETGPLNGITDHCNQIAKGSKNNSNLKKTFFIRMSNEGSTAKLRP